MQLFGVSVKRSFNPETGKCDLIEPRKLGFVSFKPTEWSPEGFMNAMKKANPPPKHPVTESTLAARVNRVAKWRNKNGR